ncbi:hypothetical protein SYNTR_1193 [Candidatus Syntrophocurvum alkaliphilum]|uniref:CRISPR-associated protein n=1 Tax=Candidatus Syntrophocurvum alkaliphilum TaxID=2293317 RepID=A0A6I6DF26_9FIRM|nr:TIGR02221 family CRISPR-associated protein [Candidatus Syntrophocurvum alkaliphilum]QGT99786.1 hypothetical protein SYNTR_1193 [Candidatus Syntrophocurvum alkaliphilum]
MKLISLLGTTDYKKTVYEFDGISVETSFFQKAIIEAKKPTEVIVFLTNRAYEKNWELLIENLDTNIPIKPVIIPEGQNEEEYWEIFSIFINEISENEELVFDITNSFRSIPMIIALLIAYVRAVKNCTVNGVYYGAFEKGVPVTPAVDLSIFADLLEWIKGLEDFIKYGDSKVIVELIKSIDLKQNNEPITYLNELADNLQEIDLCLHFSRSKQLSDALTKYSINIKSNRTEIETEVKKRAKPLYPMLAKIEKDFSMMVDSDFAQCSINLIDWLLTHEQYAQAFSYMRELYISKILIKIYGSSENEIYDFKKREEISNKLSEEFKKNNKEPKIISLWGNLIDYRNAIAHCGFKDSSPNFDKKSIENIFARFKSVINENGKNDWNKLTSILTGKSLLETDNNKQPQTDNLKDINLSKETDKTILISTLGTSDYGVATYEFKKKDENIRVETKLFQKVVVQALKPDKTIIIVTEAAKRIHKKALEDELTEYDRLNFVDIPDGRNEEELWDIFFSIINNVEDNSKVIFDITHGFRSIPFINLIAIYYLKVVKNCVIEAVYYGAYEARKDKDGVKISPTFDLTRFVTMLDWIRGIYDFIDYGDQNLLAKLINNEHQLAYQRNSDLTPKVMKKVSNNLENISSCLNFNNSEKLKQVMGLYEKIDYTKMSSEIEQWAKPYIPILERFENEFEKLNENEFDKRYSYLVEWLINHSQYWQAVTNMHEVLITKLILNNPNYSGEGYLIEKYRDKYNDLLNELVKTNSKDIEILDFWKQLKELRNDITHCGYRENPFLASLDKQEEIKELQKRFNNIIFEKNTDDWNSFLILLNKAENDMQLK